MRYRSALSVSVSCLLAYDSECFQCPSYQAKLVSIQARPYAGSKFYAINKDESQPESDKLNKKVEENPLSNLGSLFDDFMPTLAGKEEQGDNGIIDRGEKNILKEDDKQNPFIERLTSIFDGGDEESRLRKRDLIRSILRRLANLSLQDYYWRSDYFKKTEADRRVDESLARMMGEEASYIRPMDASDKAIGPLGRAEKTLVDWLSLVIEEEGRRARLISSSKGDLVRPMDLRGDAGGPLSSLENAAVTFLESIRMSEKERIKTGTFRPKDLEEEKRGPLGNLEARVSEALDEIIRSEGLRMEQSRRRGGEVVRPIDVPGPLGEMERWYLELITAERQRRKDREKNDGKLVRPQDASIQGPMGTAERQFSETLKTVKEEESRRLTSLRKVLKENRPIEKNRSSFLGWTEAFILGIFRAPQMIFRTFDRVDELLKSEALESNEEGSNISKKSK